MHLGLSTRTALVLGSTSGIGRAIADGLASEGAAVAYCGRRVELAEAAAEAQPRAIGLRLDLADPGSVTAALDALRRWREHVDILVLNGGGPPPGAAAEVAPDELAESLRTLLLAQVEIVGALLPGMRERGWGRIVAVGSSGVQEPIPGLVRSTAGRAALAGYLKTLAGEVARDGVTVNMVLPGRIDTDRLAQLEQAWAASARLDRAEFRRRALAAVPAGRNGTVSELASVAVFLCGEPASYVTGVQVRVDGGLVGSW
jgi:3-oxoacyl-[acyl-carrier protein] reductase